MSYLFVFWLDLYSGGASQVVLVVKKPPANVADVRHAVLSLGQEDPMEKGIKTDSSILV